MTWDARSEFFGGCIEFMALTRDQILANRPDLPREAVSVPELGGDVFVRVLTLKEVGEIQREQKAAPDPLRIYPKIIALGCVSDDGSPLFVGDDIKVIESLPWPAVEVLATAILRINKMGEFAPKA